MPASRLVKFTLSAVALLLAISRASSRAKEASPADEIPRGQSARPGPALSPDEAIARMKLPTGFKAEVVTAEPVIVNPTSFTFDDQGRIWVTESIEYPRPAAGKGQDRVKILESTKHDGHYDKATIFKDGLNIPCGVAIGNGGVYVTNSPDILFLRDTDGDGKADEEQVILTGFGRDDRHELPNSLTWGPDGWLYGMNGVFNQSHVASPADGKKYDFTCGVWRYHPLTKKFELFAEGTSNPWGLDYNRQGDWFVSCCVIDHIFHITQSGYYLRQGGPYPPLTQKLPSIAGSRHQQAAYAGLCIYDADAYPEPYRGRLFIGNLHGSAINQDILARNGATYVQHSVTDEDKAGADRSDGFGGVDFLHARDPWFMPVSQKIGPDGCVYVMDWYDRYHCYQDANRDSPGLDRTLGRIYRISYNGTPIFPPFDLQKAPAADLLKLLDHPNVWQRRTAQRILNEKFEPALVPLLEKLALDTADKNNAHLHALWLLVSQHALSEAFHLKVLASADAAVRNWGVRAVGETGKASPAVYDALKVLARDPSPDVRAQLAVAAGRLTEPDGLPLLEALLTNPQNARDPLIPTLIYNNLKPLAGPRGREILAFLKEHPDTAQAFSESTAPWIRKAINLTGRSPAEVVAELAASLQGNPPDEKAGPALQDVVDVLAQSALKSDERASLFDAPTRAAVAALITRRPSVRMPAVFLALIWKDPQAIAAARALLIDPTVDSAMRARLLKPLIATGDAQNVPALAALIKDSAMPVLLRQSAVDAMGSMNDAQAAELLVAGYGAMPVDLKAMTVNALTHSVAGGMALMSAIQSKTVDVRDVNANHARQLLGLADAKLSERVRATWGEVKTDRDPERVRVVEQKRKLVTTRPAGNVAAGQLVFNKVCAQCHTIYGAGGNIGPDLTGVGRENLDAVLTNLLDPNLVIGAPYLVYSARTKDGEVISGLLAEKSDQRIVLKDQTKTTAIATADIEKLVTQNISMMPEGLEKAMSDQELVDLVAFLLTREPPKAAGQ